MREIKKSTVKRENWLLTFNDMMTLVFTFFVLILSFSSMQSSEILLATDSLSMTMSPGKTEGSFKSVISPIVTPYRDRDIEVEKQKKALINHDERKAGKLKATMLAIIGGERQATVDQIRNDITVNMEEANLFKPDSYLLHRNGEQILTNIADKIRDEKINIRIECYDKNGLSERISKTSVDMSILRAGTITRHFIEQGRLEPQRLSAMGYGALKDGTKHEIKMLFRS
ncbi:MAG: flagellar motor protein MotB [Syntrophus sp. (in: bacteria)]